MTGPTEAELRLLGDLEGRRVLELGCGPTSAAIVLARGGAHVIALDPSPERIGEARLEAEDQEVRVEWHVGDLADLAFLRGDSVDLAFSSGALAEVEDVGRLFRQVHRVLKHGAPFVCAYEHPMTTCLRGSLEPGGSARSYFDPAPITELDGGRQVTRYPRTIAEVFTALVRSGFRVDMLVEPPPALGSALVPPTIIWRARKEGV